MHEFFGTAAAKRELQLFKHLVENPNRNTISLIKHDFCHWVEKAIYVGLEDLLRIGLIENRQLNDEPAYYVIAEREYGVDARLLVETSYQNDV